MKIFMLCVVLIIAQIFKLFFEPVAKLCAERLHIYQRKMQRFTNKNAILVYSQ